MLRYEITYVVNGHESKGFVTAGSDESAVAEFLAGWDGEAEKPTSYWISQRWSVNA